MFNATELRRRQADTLKIFNDKFVKCKVFEFTVSKFSKNIFQCSRNR
jgi:hypothetical protein